MGGERAAETAAADVIALDGVDRLFARGGALLLGFLAGAVTFGMAALAIALGISESGVLRGAAAGKPAVLVGGAVGVATWISVFFVLARRVPREVRVLADRLEAHGWGGVRTVRFADLASTRVRLSRAGAVVGMEVTRDDGTSLAIDADEITEQVLPALARRAAPVFAERLRSAMTRGDRVAFAEPRRARARLAALGAVLAAVGVVVIAISLYEMLADVSIVQDEGSGRRGRHLVKGTFAAIGGAVMVSRARRGAGSGLCVSTSGLGDESGSPGREIPWAGLRRIAHDDEGIQFEGTAGDGSTVSLRSTKEAQNYVFLRAAMRLDRPRAAAPVEEVGDPDACWAAIGGRPE